MTDLSVGVASVEETADLDTLVLGFAEHSDGSGWHIMLQLSLNITQQDVDLGQDTYCITTSDGAVVYGGITGWSLQNEVIHLHLTDETAEEVGLDPDVVLDLAGAQSDMNDVAAALRRMTGLAAS